MKITRGIKREPVKLVIYGVEGIGKTTLAASAPDALIIDMERGSRQIDVARVEVDNWDELLSTIKEISADPTICKTVVVDTIDWAENACIKALCHEKGWSGIEDAGYGKGWTFLGEKFSKLLTTLDECVAVGINVIILAHSTQRKIELPEEEGAFDHYELKLGKRCAPLLREWCDALLFANYKTFAVKRENKTVKGKGAERTLFTEHQACWDAKNRYKLPPELTLSWESISQMFAARERDKLDELMEVAGVAACEIQPIIDKKIKEGKALSKVREECVKNWDGIIEWLRRNNNE